MAEKSNSVPPCNSCGGTPHIGCQIEEDSITSDSPCVPSKLDSFGPCRADFLKWNEVPGELWGTIFRYLTTDLEDTPKTLRRCHLSLSQVSKRIRSLVEPFLYEEVSWTPDLFTAFPPLPAHNSYKLHQNASKRRKRLQCPPGLHRKGPVPFHLLRTLLHRPELARYIKRLNLLAPSSDFGLFWNPFEAWEYGLTAEEFTLCEKSISSVPNLSQKNWHLGLRKGRLDIAVGVLLLQLALRGRLESIDILIREDSTVGSPLFEILTAFNSSPELLGFKELKSITLSTDLREDGTDYEPAVDLEDLYNEDPFDVDKQFFNFLEFPNLESLSTYYCSPDPNWSTNLPVASNLTSLVLKQGIMNDTSLNEILASTPKLKVLECLLVYDRTVHSRLDCKDFNEKLSQVSGTLERLVISIEVLYRHELQDDMGDWDVEETMGSMKHFKKLQYLDMPVITLIPGSQTGWEAESTEPNELEASLPGSLNTLRMSNRPDYPRGRYPRGMQKIIEIYLEKTNILHRRDYKNVLY